jgi:hypothetical protein
MATAYVTLCDVVTRDCMRGDNARSETVSTSGASASGALVAGANQYAQIFCATAVYARSGGTATVATSVFCPGGVPTYIAMTEGSAVALIDA